MKTFSISQIICQLTTALRQNCPPERHYEKNSELSHPDLSSGSNKKNFELSHINTSKSGVGLIQLMTAPIFATRRWTNILLYIENLVAKISALLLPMRHHAHYASQAMMMMKAQKVDIKLDPILLNVNSVKLRQLHSLIALQQSG